MVNAFKKLGRFYKNLSIRYKILFVLQIQIIIPLILIGYMSYKFSSDIIYKKSVSYSQDILKTIELRLKDYSNNLSVLSQDLIYDETIYSILQRKMIINIPNMSESEKEKTDNNILDTYEDESTITNILKRKILCRDEIQSICIYSNAGEFYPADNNNKTIRIKNAVSNCFDDIRILVKEANGKGIWYMDGKGKKIDNVFFARAIYDRDNFKEIGIMVILVKKEFLETIYQDLITQDMRNIAIMTSDNKQIISRNPSSDYVFDTELQTNLIGENGSLIDNKNKTLVSFISMQNPTWRVVSYISLKQLYTDIDELRQWVIILSIICVAILSVLGLYLSVDFINPIKRLVDAMKKVQKGETFGNVDLDRNDELGFLNKNFNEMAKEINHLVNWIYREQLTRKEAEIKALQSQINPHFLFNTLESINWMAQLNNVPEISEMVSALSSLMEVSIGRDDRLITIQEEFTYIDNYIIILKRRFEDRITLMKSVQDGLLKVKIPRLLIQPLIENAVYHGIERIRDKGVISLSAYSRADLITIEVVDNGPGIGKEELALINEKLSMDNDKYFRSLQGEKRKSIGIENVNRRIKLFYGERYGLRIESESGSYTRVKVEIPLIKEEKGDENVQSINN